MLIRYGYELTFNCPQPTLMVCLLDAHRERSQELRYEIPTTTSSDNSDNNLSRYIWQYRAEVHGATRRPHDYVRRRHRGQRPTRSDRTVRGRRVLRTIAKRNFGVSAGSRYCETDKLADIAWRYFGSSPRGWRRVQAICDFVCGHLTFGYEHARATRTAFEAYQERIGVCRDFAHLAVAFCRCMNIPARYANGFLGDIGVPPDPAPMDYNAWFEAYLDGRWFTFDARHNTPRIGRITVAASIKPGKETSQDFAADLAALRDDVAKLTSSVSEFIRSQTAGTTSTVFEAVDNARKKISDTASKAQDRVAGASTSSRQQSSAIR